jgi:hypothetical protein
MAQLSPQQQALNASLTIASFMAQLRSLQNAIAAFLLTNTDQSYDTVLQALPTYVKNTNGTFGLYDTTAGSGTVGVTNNSTSITFSQSQTGLSGSYLVVTGDTSNGIYLIGSGSGTSWVITSPYGGSNLSTASWGTATPNSAHPIASSISGSPLNMARNDLLTAVGCLTNFGTFMTGGSLTSQGNTPQKFADILNS